MITVFGAHRESVARPSPLPSSPRNARGHALDKDTGIARRSPVATLAAAISYVCKKLK